MTKDFCKSHVIGSQYNPFKKQLLKRNIFKREFFKLFGEMLPLGIVMFALFFTWQ